MILQIFFLPLLACILLFLPSLIGLWLGYSLDNPVFLLIGSGLFTTFIGVVAFYRVRHGTPSYLLDLNGLATVIAYVFYGLFELAITLFVALWWLIPTQTQTQLTPQSYAGFLLFMMYISAFNRLPTEGRLLFRQSTFRFIHVPALFIATVGFTLGFLFT